MRRPKICLFTAHAPNVGGGGAILRSLLANLPGLDVQWYYIGSGPVLGYESGYLGPALMGGGYAKGCCPNTQNAQWWQIALY